MDLGLKDKVAVVLAASKGLGYACAESLAEEGAKLAICARSPDEIEAAAIKLKATTKADVLWSTCDVTDALHMQSFLAKTRERFGRIDILVNNCGGPRPGGFDAPLTEKDWQDAFQRSLMQVVRWTQAVSPDMVRHRWGRIAHIVSSSVRQPIDALILSNALRPGVLGYTKTASRALAPHNVTINSLLPGFILTDRTAEQARAAGVPEAEFYKKKAADVPMGRLGKPREFGDVVAFLCSERASYITGSTVTVDGGLLRGI